ncbi:type IV secretion system DNA-binding domain-containing protein [Patescibacteria group bacterium]|nr:type IV secretion system DNA-binding domain-containing protein [Patescibacteria group bacterium]MBU1722020.1 type IV secretion system DNA-binding domain-containing protein [Patescibacteria group bacterium]MBU1901230.1 type IV secretion system DNA-binding domain-containing protein [Patescibacteria group bacterium]
MLFQLTINPYGQSPVAGVQITEQMLMIGLFILFIVTILLAGLFILRAILHSKNEKLAAFNRVVMQIQVPKERKSEGQGGQAGSDDRLEHIKEEIGITETFFSTVAGLKAKKGFLHWFNGKSEDIAFEIVMHNGLIYFYIDVPKKIQSFIEQQIHAQYPHAEIDIMTDYNIFTEQSTILGAYLYAENKHVFPFKTYKTMDSDPLSAILNVLAKIREHNSSAAIQFVVRSAKKSWRSEGIRIVREVKQGKKFEDVTEKSALKSFFKNSGKTMGELLRDKKKDEAPEKQYQLSGMEEEMLKGVEEKLSKGGIEVTLRVMTASDNPILAQSHLDNLLNSFSQYNLYRYGNSFKAAVPRNQKRLIQDFIYRTFEPKWGMTFNTEEMASVWHLPLHSTEAPNIKWLSGRSAPPPPNLPDSGLLMGFVDYRGQRNDVFLKEADRRRHLYIIGKSGSGKSVTIANLAIQDIQDGKGVCIVDPHGDLVEAVLQHVPKHRADDVIIFNPSDLDRPIGLNMLEPKTEDQRDFAVQEMIGIFYKLFPPEMIGPMFEHQMRNVMLTLMADINDPGTIIDIPRMFTDDDYVKIYLDRVTDPVVRAFWEKEMAKTSDHTKSEMLGYLVSKVGRFVGNEMMRNIMGQQKSALDFRDIMDNEKILLVNLAKGKTGEVNSKLLGLIIVAKLQMAAMGRADMEEADRKDFYLYIDEFQNFITDSISTILSEARKYKLDLIVAHQYMGQLVDDKGKADVRDAILGNVGTILSGRIGPDDAEILAKEFAPVFGSYDLINAPQYSFYAKMLIDNQASKPFLMRAYPPKEGNKELAAAITQLSRLKYGRNKQIVSAEIIERSKLGEITKGDTSLSEASL